MFEKFVRSLFIATFLCASFINAAMVAVGDADIVASLILQLGLAALILLIGTL